MNSIYKSINRKSHFFRKKLIKLAKVHKKRSNFSTFWLHFVNKKGKYLFFAMVRNGFDTVEGL